VECDEPDRKSACVKTGASSSFDPNSWTAQSERAFSARQRCYPELEKAPSFRRCAHFE